MIDLDDNGQPTRGFNASRNAGRTQSELAGICKGILFDNVVTTDEILGLHEWLGRNLHVSEIWPGKVIAERLRRVLADGIVDDEERAELVVLLQKFVGGSNLEDGDGRSNSTALPLCDPAPVITFPRSSFCFTGTFVYGTRRTCREAIESLGGFCEDGVVRKLNYLVIGTVASRDWRESTYGNKILKAVELKQSGLPLRIVGERHWLAQLQAQL